MSRTTERNPRFATSTKPCNQVTFSSCAPAHGPSKGVGIVAGPAEFDQAWIDVDGWNIRHTRRVRWLTIPTDFFGREGFGTQGSTLQRVWDVRLLAKPATLPVDPSNLRLPLRPKPAPGTPSTSKDWSTRWSRKGLAWQQQRNFYPYSCVPNASRDGTGNRGSQATRDLGKEKR